MYRAEPSIRVSCLHSDTLYIRTTIVDNAVDPNKKRLGLTNGNNIKKPAQGSSKSVVNQLTSQPSSQNIYRNSSTPTLQASHFTSTPHNPSLVVQAQRHVLIHLLAIKPSTSSSIQEMTAITAPLLQQLLDQLCEQSGTKKNPVWSLSPRRFKELDVWNFPYSSDSDRQLAIDSAISALDKQRVHPSDRLWQLLLPLDERNKGKTLSRLHSIPSDHRKLLKNLESQTSQRSTTSNSDEMPRHLVRADGTPVSMKRARETANAHASTASTNGKKPKALSSERIDKSDEDYEVAAANGAGTTPKPDSTTARKPSIMGTKRKAEKEPTVDLKPVPPSGADSASKNDAKRPKISNVLTSKRLEPGHGANRPLRTPAEAIAAPPKPRTIPKATKLAKALTPTAPASQEAAKTVPRAPVRPESNPTKPTKPANTPAPTATASPDTAKTAPKAVRKTPEKPEATLVRTVKPGNTSLFKSQPAQLEHDSDAKRDRDMEIIEKAKKGVAHEKTLSREATFESYREYYEVLQTYKAWNKAVDHASSTYAREAAARFKPLATIQEVTLKGLEDLIAQLRSPVVGPVVGIEEKHILSIHEAEVLKWKVKACFLEWKLNYRAIRDDFGSTKPDDMVEFFDHLRTIKRDQISVIKACALKFGKEKQGALEGVDLEKTFPA